MYVQACVCVWQQTAQKSLQLTKSSQQPCADCDCDAAAAAAKDAESQAVTLSLSLSITHTHTVTAAIAKGVPGSQRNEPISAQQSDVDSAACRRHLPLPASLLQILCFALLLLRCVLRWKLSSLPYFRFSLFAVLFWIYFTNKTWLLAGKKEIVLSNGFPYAFLLWN